MDQLADFFLKLFDYSDWPPRWHCGKWSEFHGWLYIISDLLIWSAYFTIPLVIIRFITRKSDASFVKLYFLFAAFILACGATHFLDAVTFWFPLYRLNALVRLITGIVSWVTVFYIVKFLPVAFTLKSHKLLENEIAQRKIIEAELRFSQEQVETIYRNAPDAVIVINSKGNIVKWNPAAEKMLGWQEEEVLGKVLNELIVPEQYRQQHIDAMKHFLKTGTSPLLNETIYQQVFTRDQSPLLVEFTVSPVQLKDDFLFIGFVRDATEKRKAELGLKESEERYRLLTSEVFEYAIVLLTPEGNISSWNEGAQRITGYTAQEITGKHFSLLYPADKIAEGAPSQKLAAVNVSGRVETEGWRLKKDGMLFCANVIVTALKRDGEIIGYSKITRDVTERRNTEEKIRQLNLELEQRVIERTNELQESEKKYRKLFVNNPLPLWVIELPSLKFLDVNEVALANYGYSREEFLSMTAKDIRPTEDKKRFLSYDHSLMRGISNAGTWRHMKKDGSVIYVDINSHEMNFGDKSARLVLSIDITDRKKAEERLDFALDAGQIGIWELDLSNDTSVRNIRHDQLFGYEEAIPHWGIDDLRRHIHPDDQESFNEDFTNALTTNHWVMETKIIWPDNSIHFVLINGKVINDQAGKAEKILGTVVDITKIKQAEEEIKELNNDLEQRVLVRTRELNAVNKELEAFSYSVSHDLRAPLRAIHGYSQILVEDYKERLDVEGNRILDRVMFNAKKMSGLIDDLLDFSRLGKKTMHKTAVALDTVVKEVIEELTNSSKYQANITVEKLGTAIVDEVSIRLVFQNLLLNATKYSSKKDNPQVLVGKMETEHGTTYFVKDNGAGFDMTYYDKLFGVFQRFHRQEEFEGTGVGLAIVQRIILKHGGQVWAASVVNEGATFYFTLQ